MRKKQKKKCGNGPCAPVVSCFVVAPRWLDGLLVHVDGGSALAALPLRFG
jgi:hypothetical protein